MEEGDGGDRIEWGWERGKGKGKERGKGIEGKWRAYIRTERKRHEERTDGPV